MEQELDETAKKAMREAYDAFPRLLFVKLEPGESGPTLEAVTEKEYLGEIGVPTMIGVYKLVQGEALRRRVISERMMLIEGPQR